ncbi:PD-(D/E)XK nuclease family transposase [Virgibacillus dakarensis]|nr:PD-(D/E)XK nuclease family transposase [Virgibacillus dakarensis]
MTDKLEIHFIETLEFMDFIKNIDLHNPLHRWLIFLKVDNNLLLKVVISMDKNITEAEEKLSALNLDKELKKACGVREKEINDEITRMRGARDEGKIEGKREIIEAMRKNGITDEI